ncbi:MAG: ATP synthase F1 subunit epsilon [Chloroflexi bacterium]|nr:ATP synthase F1 subunit epsilon [Chloroflexota bacterium]
MPVRCEIVSQDRIVYQNDVNVVVLPGAEGDMGILPNHAPLLTVLRYGIITVRTNKGEEYFTVAGGVAEVQPDQVTVLADAAENVKEINVQRAEAAKQRAEELLKNVPPQQTDEYLVIQAALRRSNLRLNAAKHQSHK